MIEAQLEKTESVSFLGFCINTDYTDTTEYLHHSI